MKIREYVNNDFEVVLSILKKSFPEVLNEINEALVDSNSLDLDRDRYVQLVYVLDDVVVGYLIASRSFDPIIKKNNYWIDYVCVDEEYRGRGIARELLKKIEDIASLDDAMFLQLTSSRFRTSARKLYLDLGYQIRESDIFRKVL